MLKDIDNVEKLYDYIRKNIKYGFKAKDFNIYCRYEMNNDMLYEYLLFNNYCLQKPSELIKSKYGICYDQVELMRYWMIKHNYEVFTFYTPYHNHAFLIYKENNNYNIIETSIKEYNGIHKFNSLEEALENYKNFQLKNTKIKDIKFYKYDKAKYGCDICTFIYNITKDKN